MGAQCCDGQERQNVLTGEERVLEKRLIVTGRAN